MSFLFILFELIEIFLILMFLDIDDLDSSLIMFSLISFDEWIKEYIFWELELLKILGYDLELNEFVNKKNVNNEIVYVTKNINNMKIVPNFLINRDESVIDLKILINGLKLVGDFMDKNILKPNNLNHPLSRNYFISSIK